MKKKIITMVVIIIAIILLFPLPMRLKDGGSVEYKALLYTVTKYHKLSGNPNQMYIDGLGIEILGMEIYNSAKEQENELEKEQNKDTSRTKISNVILKAEETDTKELVTFNDILYGRSYGIIDFDADSTIEPIGIINKLIGKEYIPQLNGETNTESLLNAKVYSANENSMILLVGNEAVLYRAIQEINYSFLATVIESTAKYIIVEPEEGSQERKSSDKISIGLGEKGDAIYPVGLKLKITYNGVIMETYPAKINAINIELAN